MSCDIAIRVDALSKCYHVYANPQDRLKQAVWRGRRTYYREFWALHKVSFDVGRGETVGIIGRNGCGKSTLLQMICGTLTPTDGSVYVNGRIAALLELGAGFNPEFSGRENVYMNAALLGLSRAEIEARYKDIVAFSEIDSFMDQPVKTYSSGMFVRLAFAVAVHSDPEILVVDEALAVGDAPFQAKCMSRMRQLMESGVTVLFVSHDIGAVKTLCRRAVLLDHGKMLAFGDTAYVVDQYTRLIHLGEVGSESVPDVLGENHEAGFPELNPDEGNTQFRELATIQRMGDGRATLLNVVLLRRDGKPCGEFRHGQDICLRMVVRVDKPMPLLTFGYHVRDRNGVDVLYADSLIEECSIKEPVVGSVYVLDWRFAAVLRNGQYNVACVVSGPPESVSGRPVVCEDLRISDFVAVAAQFNVFGDTILHGFVHVDNQVNVRLYADRDEVST